MLTLEEGMTPDSLDAEVDVTPVAELVEAAASVEEEAEPDVPTDIDPVLVSLTFDAPDVVALTPVDSDDPVGDALLELSLFIVPLDRVKVSEVTVSELARLPDSREVVVVDRNIIVVLDGADPVPCEFREDARLRPEETSGGEIPAVVSVDFAPLLLAKDVENLCKLD